MNKERYNNLDGLRTISCICIIAYHIKKYSQFQLSGIGSVVVDSWTQFVPLFLMISGFGIFCGYYEKLKYQNIDLTTFYEKRYSKILPFFSFVMIIDVVMERSLSHLIEALTQATLVFGLLPNVKMEVCGIGWTLGIIFLFYMLFPFICSLCDNKKGALITFVVSIIISVFCTEYFYTTKFVVEGFTPRHNFLYCAPFFLAGGITYLYRNSIIRFVSKNRSFSLSVCVLVSIGWYYVPAEVKGFSLMLIKNLIVFMLWLWYAISVNSRLLSNKTMKHISSISLEIYLVQMVIFRAVEKFFGIYFAGTGWHGFLLVWGIVLILDIILVETWKLVEGKVKMKLSNAL